jgi:hypothetical protein
LLASLLPGLREVRAPLAAGYLWIAVAWVILEPSIPERDDAKGVMASLYRALDLPSVIGIGLIASFAAYLIGKLATNALGPALRTAFPPPPDDQGKDSRRTPLSQPARAALEQVVRRSHDQLTTALALSGPDADVGRFLEKQLRRPLPAEGFGPPRPVAPPPSKRMPPPEGPGSMEPQDEDARHIALMVQAVLVDLDVVAKTRLLGRDPELYAEVDRNRAAVEFDLAVAPPLLALAIAVGARSDPLVAGVLVALGALLAWGLFRDAVRSETVANQLLLQSIEDRRVYLPTLERLETAAAQLASRQHPDFMRAAAEDAALALQAAIVSLERVGNSEPALARHARRQVELAEEPVAHVRRLFPAPVTQTAEEALDLLKATADGWVATMDGLGPPAEDPHDRLTRAQKLLADFQSDAREAVLEATTLGGPKPDGQEPKR